jgi:DNA modification methylase
LAGKRSSAASRVNRIIQGDCVEGMREYRAGSVHLAFADPPFNIGYDYDKYDDKRSCEDYLGWSKDWISEVIRLLTPGGAFWLAIGDEYAAELKVMCTRELGLSCRNWIVWYYTFGVHCKAKFTRSHAHLFYFTKPGEDFTFNDDAIRVPSARQLVYADKRADPKGRVPDDTWIMRPTPHESWILRPQDIPESFEADSDTWYFPRVCGTFKERMGFHGCQMPEQLLGRIIRACSNEGDRVLDPFAGSGTTLAVAKKLRRKYLGFELSEEYAAQSSKRLSLITRGDPLDGTENPLTSVANTANGKVRTADGKRMKRDGTSASHRPRRKSKESAVEQAQRGLWG